MINPLPSAPTGDLPSLQIKDGENRNKMVVNGPVGGGRRATRDAILVRDASVNRKKRTNRQRRVYFDINMGIQINPLEVHSQVHSHPIFNSSTSLQLSPESLGLLVQSQRSQRRGYHSHTDAQEIKINDLKFLLQKKLQNSDVGSLGRIVIPKKEAEAHLPALAAREGMPISMVDMDTLETWNFRYRYWPNNKSRMYVLEGTGQFVRSHLLIRGDFIMLYKDDISGIYVIKGMHAQDAERNRLEQSTNARDSYEVSNEPPVYSSGLNYQFAVEDNSTIFNKFPEIETEVTAGLPNSPSLDPIPMFGFDEMLSLEDLFTSSSLPGLD